MARWRGEGMEGRRDREEGIGGGGGGMEGWREGRGGVEGGG